MLRGLRAAAHGLVTGAHRGAQIAKALDLSQPQRTQLAALWVSFEARVARVLAARRHLHQRIGATMPNGYMGRDFAVNFLKAHEAMDALKFNLRQEHIVIYDFTSNFHQARPGLLGLPSWRWAARALGACRPAQCCTGSCAHQNGD